MLWWGLFYQTWAVNLQTHKGRDRPAAMLVTVCCFLGFLQQWHCLSLFAFPPADATCWNGICLDSEDHSDWLFSLAQVHENREMTNQFSPIYCSFFLFLTLPLPSFFQVLTAPEPFCFSFQTYRLNKWVSERASLGFTDTSSGFPYCLTYTDTNTPSWSGEWYHTKQTPIWPTSWHLLMSLQCVPVHHFCPDAPKWVSPFGLLLLFKT